MSPSEVVANYRNNLLGFVAAARQISAGALNTPPAEGEWPPAYVIHHMADSELQFAVRYSNILVEDSPAIVPFDEEQFPSRLQYQGRSVEASLAALESVVTLNCEILSAITEADWSRLGNHTARGPFTLTKIVELCSGHIGGHIDQLKKSIA